MNDVLPIGWGFLPGATFTAKPRPPRPSKRQERAPRRWWQVSQAESVVVDELLQLDGLAASVRGADIRDRYSLRWDSACRIARVARAIGRGELPEEGAAHLEVLRERNKRAATSGQEGVSK